MEESILIELKHLTDERMWCIGHKLQTRWDMTRYEIVMVDLGYVAISHTGYITYPRRVW